MSTINVEQQYSENQYIQIQANEIKAMLELYQMFQQVSYQNGNLSHSCAQLQNENNHLNKHVAKLSLDLHKSQIQVRNLQFKMNNKDEISKKQTGDLQKTIDKLETQLIKNKEDHLIGLEKEKQNQNQEHKVHTQQLQNTVLDLEEQVNELKKNHNEEKQNLQYTKDQLNIQFEMCLEENERVQNKLNEPCPTCFPQL